MKKNLCILHGRVFVMFKTKMRKIEEDLYKSTKQDKEKESSIKCNIVNHKSSDMN